MVVGFIIFIGVFIFIIMFLVDINLKVWWKEVVDDIFDKILVIRLILKVYILKEMEIICFNILDNLEYIFVNLKEFKLEVFLMD